MLGVFLLHAADLAQSSFVLVVDEMAAWTVRAEPNRMERSTSLRLVFGMSRHWPQLGLSVSKLTFVTVFTIACFIKWPTYFMQGILDSAESVHHAAGTCRMGIDENAVVDPQLRVRGVDNLRVADASIMPRIVSGNTHAASVMIGDRVAELLQASA